MNRSLYIYLLLLSFIPVLFSCRDSELKRMPDTLPDIRGTVSSVSGEPLDKEVVVILVKSGESSVTRVSEASIKVTEETKIENNTGKTLSKSALKQGQEVEVWFGERVMESQPVQTDAIAIRITSQE